MAKRILDKNNDAPELDFPGIQSDDLNDDFLDDDMDDIDIDERPRSKRPGDEAASHAYYREQRKKKRKKVPTWMKVLGGIVIALCLIFLLGVGFIFAQLGKINKAESVEYLDADSEYFEADEDAMYDVMDPNAVQWSDKEKVEGDDDVINILLIGQDKREGETRARSDAMIIATINKTDKKIKLTSLMRDLYVQIPGYSDNRINASYAFGGMELLNETIEKNFDIEIDGNVEVDFKVFEQLIDLIEGLDIYVTAEEVPVMNMYIKDINKRAGRQENESLITRAGTQHMDGAQTLAYARIRSVGNSDFGRTERQRKVLIAAYQKATDMSLTDIMEVIDVALPMLTTDMSSLDLINLATDVYQMDLSVIHTYNIPEDAVYENANIQGMDVLVPDLDECRKVLSEIIYEDKE